MERFGKDPNKKAVLSMVIYLTIFILAVVFLYIPDSRIQDLNNTDAIKPIDLVDSIWYAHRGFAIDDIGGFDTSAPEVRMITSFPIRLNAIFEPPKGINQNEFSLMTTFNCDQSCLDSNISLFLAEIGENWAIYLNGNEVYSEIYLDPQGQMIVHRTIKRPLIPLPGKYLEEGKNTLVFRIIGDAPVSNLLVGYTPGLSMARGYVIDTTQNLLNKRLTSGASSWFQIGVYAIFAAFQLYTFFKRRQRQPQFLGLFLISCVVYSLATSNITYTYVFDTAWIDRLVISINVIWPVLIGFTVWTFLFDHKPTPKFLKGLLITSICFILAIYIIPFSLVEVINNVTMILIAVGTTYNFLVILHADKAKTVDVKPLLIAAIIILVMIFYANMEWFFIRSGFDLTSWIPFALSLTFMAIYVDRIWRMNLELSESYSKLKNLREIMELEILNQTSELRNANSLLEDKLKEINQLHGKMYHMALHDTLTGLYNRHFLAETLEREFARAQREGHTIGIIMIDIDHFKSVNDTFGHKAGDEVLRSLGEQILSHIRQEDVAFRYGGEEFLIILPRARMADTMNKAEELRALIEEIRFPIETEFGQITISAGVAEYPTSGSTPDEVLTRVDSALYAAKKSGRNRVTIDE